MNSTATIISNGKLHINIDHFGRIKDVYFPHVGQENQLGQYINSFYFFFQGKFIKLDEEEFEFTTDLVNEALISKSIIKHRSGQWQVELIDCIDEVSDIHFRDILVTNLSQKPLTLLMYFEHNFSLLESAYADTILWHQPSGNFWHYKRDRHIVFGAFKPFYQFSCAAKDDNNTQGVRPDINGELDLNPVSTGNVCSVLSFKFELGVHKRLKAQLFYSYATDSTRAFRGAVKARQINTKYLRQKQILKMSMKYDELFNVKEFRALSSVLDQKQLEDIIFNYKRSILIMCSQINHNGAVIAGNDGQYIKSGGLDHYSYLWPRDAAVVAKSLFMINAHQDFVKILDHTLDLLSAQGYFLHKYLPSASKKELLVGSTWHSYITDQGLEILPIQEDATLLWALVLIDFLLKNKRKPSLWNKYLPYLKRMVRFLIKHTFKNDPKREVLSKYLTGVKKRDKVWFLQLQDSYLPLPSYDIWEQYFGVFSLNALLLYEVLTKLNDIFQISPDVRLENKIIGFKEGLKNDIAKHLVNKEGVLIKGIRFDKDTEQIVRDESADSSLYLLSDLSISMQIDLSRTFAFLDHRLFLQGNIGGIARKENDHYLKVSEEFTGNPWFICSMWRFRAALKAGEMEFAKKIILWSLLHFDRTGLIPEQTDPTTGYSLGIKPLTWSHAEYLLSVVQLIGSLQTRNK